MFEPQFLNYIKYIHSIVDFEALKLRSVQPAVITICLEPTK